MKKREIVVVAFIYNDKNQFLACQRSNKKDFLPNKWELVGGRKEFGEDCYDALKREVKEELGIDIYNFPLGGDGTGDVNNYLKSLLTIHKAKQERKPVLVHCSAGAQRTGGVVALYRFFFQKKDADFVLKELKKYGWKYKSNPKLPAFLNENMPYLAEKLVEEGVISEIPSPLPKLPTP